MPAWPAMRMPMVSVIVATVLVATVIMATVIVVAVIVGMGVCVIGTHETNSQCEFRSAVILTTPAGTSRQTF